MKILVIGESCQDVFEYGVSDRLCPEAPVPVFNPTKTVKNGGMAMNVYRNLEALGVATEMITNNNWEKITKTRFVDFKTNHMFMRLDNNDEDYGRCDLNLVDFAKYDAVIISDYNKGYISEQDIKEISLSHNLTFLDTKKILGSWAEDISFIKINDYEFKRTLHNLTSKLIDKLIVTMGPDGCMYHDSIFPVPKVEIKDSSGAGDTFISALAFKFVQTGKIHESIAFANSCATYVVQKRGVNTV